MNTAVKIIPQQRVLPRESVGVKEESLVLCLPEVRVLLLLLVALLSAVFLVYVKDLNRQLFVNLQSEFSINQQLQIDESKLLLEQSAWSKQARVQQLAEGQFDMQIPPIANIVVLKLGKKLL